MYVDFILCLGFRSQFLIAESTAGLSFLSMGGLSAQPGYSLTRCVRRGVIFLESCIPPPPFRWYASHTPPSIRGRGTSMPSQLSDLQIQDIPARGLEFQSVKYGRREVPCTFQYDLYAPYTYTLLNFSPLMNLPPFFDCSMDSARLRCSLLSLRPSCEWYASWYTSSGMHIFHSFTTS